MQIETVNDITVLTPSERQIDITNSVSFGTGLTEAIVSQGKYILDLKNVGFLDSSALGKIVTALRKLNENEGKLVICGMNDAVELLFRMVRLSQIAVLVKDRSAALAEFGISP